MDHINKLSIIINRLVSVNIIFDNEVYALILLASLPNSWELMRAAVNSIHDTIIVEEVRKRDFGEVLTLNSILTVENKGSGFEKKIQ